MKTENNIGLLIYDLNIIYGQLCFCNNDEADTNVYRLCIYKGEVMKVQKVRTLIQWIKIYCLYQSAFPREEKKPFSMIVSMWKRGKTDVWYCEKGNIFAGMVITINAPDRILLDYLAVNRKIRGQGLGSKMLQSMRQLYDGKEVFLEIEMQDETAENHEERKRRKQFYLRNGMSEMKVYIKLFGVDMELLGFDCSFSFEEYHEFYRTNYNEWAASHISEVKMEEIEKMLKN